MELPDVLFKPKIEKIKKIYPEKNSLCFRKMELSGFNIKKYLIFFQKKAFLIFREKERELSYVSVSNFPRSKNFLIFWEMELSGPKNLIKLFKIF